MSMEHMSLNFKTLRENLSLTQKQLGEYLGKSREEISYYENSQREIPLEILEKASNLFGVELTDFFSEEEPVGIAFAFRSEDLNKEDLDTISKFKKIMKNYQRINRLTESL